MKDKSNFSRRGFFRSAALAAPVILSAGIASACKDSGAKKFTHDRNLPDFSGVEFNSESGPAGLLYSQIGYELGGPARIIIRLPDKGLVENAVLCRLISGEKEEPHERAFTYWGQVWGSHWWVAEFENFAEEGEWQVEVWQSKKCLIKDSGVIVGKNLLWNKTVELAAADMLERRVHFTKVGAGWQDAGTLWVESCAQSAMVIALEDLLERGQARLNQELLSRIWKQVTVGCNYLVMLEQKARELGYPEGAQSHDLHGHERDILPADVLKAVVALSRASLLLPDKYAKEKDAYRSTAIASWNWLTTTARPLGSYGMSLFQRGLPEDTKIPQDEWQTRDLMMFCLAALRMNDLGVHGAIDKAAEYARQIAARQIPETENENGFFGHFYEFSSLKYSEKSWTHGIVNNQFGADLGGIYPNHLLPIIELLRKYPDHQDAGVWKSMLVNFVKEYLVPACAKNPFYLVPQGIFGKEGPVWFCGTFHGTNTIYGHTAALAFELYDILKDKRLLDIAYGNLYWIAGLNAGITKENLREAVIFSADVPQGIALPASMMCGVGRRWAGTWFQTRGVVCNGFSTGKQFVYDTAPMQANDGPFSFTDEDWIPHSAAWLSALVRLDLY